MKLKTGDLIDIVAPGSASKSDDLQAGLQVIHSWGLKTRVSNLVHDKHPFHAGEDKQRFNELKKALLAKDSRMVWFARGGYGCLRLLPELEKIKPLGLSKIILGYSDITSLHIFFQQKWKLKTLHGPVVESLRPDRLILAHQEELRQILFGEVFETKHDLNPLNGLAQKTKIIDGILSGGNLVVAQSHCGSQYSLKGKNKILFFEDIGERGYRLDRALYQMQLSGAFSEAKAIVFGQFTGGNELNGESFVNFALERFAQSIKVPVYSGLQVGHGSVNRVMVNGQKSSILLQKGSPVLIINTSL